MKEDRICWGTFVVLVSPFIQPTAGLVGRFASGGQVGLCRRLAPSLVGLCDGCGVSGVGQAAVTFLRPPVKPLQLRAVGAEGRGGGAGVPAVAFRLVTVDDDVLIGGFLPPRSKGVEENKITHD